MGWSVFDDNSIGIIGQILHRVFSFSLFPVVFSFSFFDLVKSNLCFCSKRFQPNTEKSCNFKQHLASKIGKPNFTCEQNFLGFLSSNSAQINFSFDHSHLGILCKTFFHFPVQKCVFKSGDVTRTRTMVIQGRFNGYKL